MIVQIIFLAVVLLQGLVVDDGLVVVSLVTLQAVALVLSQS